MIETVALSMAGGALFGNALLRWRTNPRAADRDRIRLLEAQVAMLKVHRGASTPTCGADISLSAGESFSVTDERGRIVAMFRARTAAQLGRII